MRATLTRIPAATMVMTSEDPPKEMNGSGMPVTGSTPDDGPDVDDGLAGDPARGGHGQQGAEAVGGPARGPQPVPGQRAEQAQDDEGADQPALLADDREDEVGVGVGQQPPLLPPPAEAEAVEVARAQSHERLHHLVARPLGVGEGIEERQQPGAPVGLGQSHDQPDDGGHPERLEHGPQRDAPGVEQGEGDEGQHQGRPHVGLLEHERRPTPPAGRAAGPPRRSASSSRSARRASRSAAKTAMASFMSSEGWMRSGPKPIHRLEPPGDDADPGHEHGHQQAPASSSEQHDAQPAPPVVAHRGSCRRRRWRRAPSTAPGARRSSTPTRSTAATCRPRRTAPSRGRCRTGCDDQARARRCASRSGRGVGAERRPVGAGAGVPLDHPQMAAGGSPSRRGARRRRRRWRRRSRGRSVGRGRRSRARARTQRAKSSPRSRVGRVPVERRARRRQHHGVAGPGHGRGPARRPSAIDGASHHRAPARRRRPSPRRPPRRWPPRPAGRRPPSASTERSRPLLRPPAMSTAERKPLHGGQHGAGRGRLGVVVEPHPASLAHQLHPVGEPPEGHQGPPAALGAGPRGQGRGRRRTARRPVVRQRPGELVHPGHHDARPGPRARRPPRV